MFCQECGKEIADSSAFCAHCGARTANSNNPIPQQPAPAQQGQYIPSYPQQYQHTIDPNEPVNIAIIIVCVLIPIVGIIMGCVYMSDGRKKAGKAYLIASLVTIGVSILVFIICLIIFASLASSVPYYW